MSASTRLHGDAGRRPLALAGRRPWAVVVAIVTLAACSTSQDLREWQASDHDVPPGGEASPPAASGRPEAPDPNPSGIDDVVIDVWQARCVRCHGPAGRGDGPEGRMVRAPNLTDPGMQATRTDAELRATILNGRGSMPGLGSEGPILDGLVALVRMLGGRAPVPDPAVPAPSSSAATAVGASVGPDNSPVASSSPGAAAPRATARGDSPPRPAATATAPAVVAPPTRSAAPTQPGAAAP